ncbi:MAG: hypothetical protein AB4080_14750 [Trichodesmium sp.]
MLHHLPISPANFIEPLRGSIQSTQLCGFHADPADQIIVATAKIHGSLLVTQDQKILNYFQRK